MVQFDVQELEASLKSNLTLIIKENQNLAAKIQWDTVVQMIPFMKRAKKLFFAGAGRSGLALRSAAMRMMHLGHTVYIVGDTNTPAIGSEDLLIIASGSGTTSSMVTAAEKAKKAGATVLAISTVSNSPLANLAQLTILIPAAQKQDYGTTVSSQYAGSLFEQSILLLMDAVFQTMWTLDGAPAEELWKRHANLE